jgi:ABC-type transporter Mla subunit MlaD
MATAATKHRNNVRAGVFVTITLIVAMAIIIVLSGAWRSFFTKTARYVVAYEVSSGVRNLQSGSDVRVGGLLMGSVDEVVPVIADTGELSMIEVVFSLDDRVQLFSDAKVFVTSPLIGSDAWLDIPSVGTAAAGAPPEARLNGAESVGILTTLLGPDNAHRAEEVTENVRQFSRFLARVPEEYDNRIAPALDDAGEAISNIREVTHDVRHDDWPRWSDNIDRMLDRALTLADELEQAATEGRTFMTDARAMLSDNREDIDASIDNVRAASESAAQATDRINVSTLDKVDAFLDRGNDGLASATQLIERVQEDYEYWSSDLSEGLASATLASQQLKLASIEIRRSPWKLLYRPGTDELEHELLYEAARSFALAATELKTTSQSVQQILDRYGDRLDDDGRTMQRLQSMVIDSLDRYEKAQQNLFDVLVVEVPE